MITGIKNEIINTINKDTESINSIELYFAYSDFIFELRKSQTKLDNLENYELQTLKNMGLKERVPYTFLNSNYYLGSKYQYEIIIGD